MPAEIRTLIVDKAEGNPFFIEEVTKSLIEVGALRRTANGYALGRPVSEIVIPNTIQDVIMARIDRLGDEPKRAIQIASVIGREFAVRLLQRAGELGDRVNPLVGELRALELIYEKSGVPELAYMFKHALTHDVAYESLLVQRRKLLHHTIGRAIEELYADRLPEHWETLGAPFLSRRGLGAGLQLSGERGRQGARGVRQQRGAALLRARPRSRRASADRARGSGRRFSRARDARTSASASSRRRSRPTATALGLVSSPADRARLNAALAEALLWAHEFDAALAAADEALAIAEHVRRAADRR